MIESKCYITPKNRAVQKDKAAYCGNGVYHVLPRCGARRKRQER